MLISIWGGKSKLTLSNSAEFNANNLLKYLASPTWKPFLL